MDTSRKRLAPGDSVPSSCEPNKKQRVDTNLTIQQKREALPIFARKKELLKAVAGNQVLVVVGDTGSGKSTQIPQYLAEGGYGELGCIACTQPRRVAASSIATRVSVEYGCELGDQVGYTIRFEDCTTSKTCITYMTDGMLIKKCLKDRAFSGYSVVMLDEAHERTISTDILIGLLKAAIKERRDLRVIVASATMDTEKFAHYFNGAPVFKIEGRTYPVDIIYLNPSNKNNFIFEAQEKVIELHMTEPPGDVLVFLTGQEDIESLCESLEGRISFLGTSIRKLIVLPLYSSLDLEQQMKVFIPTPPGARKVVVATNIAESALTIDGIVYVLDSGFVKQRIHKPKTGMDALETITISKAQATQRAGRAGRTAPGKCYRLYSEEDYSAMPPLFVPEIQRSDLASILLKMKAMGLNDVVTFDFMDMPSPDAMAAALFHLHLIGALEYEDETLTDLGKKMSQFPLEPSIAKYLILSVDMGCSDEVLTIVSMLSVQNLQRLFKTRKMKRMAEQKHVRFHMPEGDHLTLLEIYNAWRDSRYSDAWCGENFLASDSLRKAQEIRGQLLYFMDRENLSVISCGKNIELVQKTICAAFFFNAAERKERANYVTLKDGAMAFLRRDCSLFFDRPKFVVCNELLRTKQSYLQQVTRIQPHWLAQFAPSYFYLDHYSNCPIFKTNVYDDLWKRASESAAVS